MSSQRPERCLPPGRGVVGESSIKEAALRRSIFPDDRNCHDLLRADELVVKALWYLEYLQLEVCRKARKGGEDSFGRIPLAGVVRVSSEVTRCILALLVKEQLGGQSGLSPRMSSAYSGDGDIFSHRPVH